MPAETRSIRPSAAIPLALFRQVAKAQRIVIPRNQQAIIDHHGRNPVPVCAAADVPVNGVISREVGDELVAIYNIEGMFYATEARCTHGLADLADGTLRGRRRSSAASTSARSTCRAARRCSRPASSTLKTYKTEVKDGQVLVDLDTPADTAAT